MKITHLVRTLRLRVPSGHLYRVDIVGQVGGQITNITTGAALYVPDGPSIN